MPLGILGKKLGQTRVYDAKGVITPVTIVLAGPNRVLQCKAQQSDGYNAVQLTLADWWPRAYPDPDYRQWVSAEWARRLERAREQGSGFEPMEADIRAKDGTLRTVVASAASLGEAFAGTHLAILYDITALKRAEAALRASEDRLRTIVETEPECVKILDADGRLLEMNPAGLAMIEADSLAQVRGKSVVTIVSTEQRAAFTELGRRVIEKGGSGRLEFEIIGLKGTHRWLETNAVPLRDPASGEVRLLGITRDITERKQAEAELQRYRDQLEQRVKDRIAALEAANEELPRHSVTPPPTTKNGNCGQSFHHSAFLFIGTLVTRGGRIPMNHLVLHFNSSLPELSPRARLILSRKASP